jgi:hypothetical protein
MIILLRVFAFGCLAMVAACGGAEQVMPPVATPVVTLSHSRAPAGSPIEITYRFDVAGDAAFSEDYRVFVHVLDADDERMWDDDHDPAVPTRTWKPGQSIEYTRTLFVPVFPYVGRATIRIGLHSTRTQERLPLAAQEAGQRAYTVAELDLLPQTDNLFTVFKEGWHPAEVAGQNGDIEWQWTKKEASLAFKNPKKDAVLYLDLDSPTKALHGDQQVQVVMGGTVLESFVLAPDQRVLRKIKLPAAAMGTSELAELQIGVDKPFVPVVVSGGSSKDPRELGVRVFHAYVDPR